ncbi:hypothetical protein BMS3Bbin10_00126 [bacterium BMS3Bbin10]|nr:hypothetical protein BMS3Bbin10_00126 [bacterium BMS3Bbin10]
MSRDRKEEAWAEAVKMASSGDYKSASHVEDIMRSNGYSHEVNAWRGKWEHDRLDQLCRDGIENKNNT